MGIETKTLWGKAVAVGLALVAAVGLLAGGGRSESFTAHNTVVGVELRLVAAGVPQQAWTTLGLIDKGEWPPSDCPGTHGGTVWQNRGGQLPAGVGYREWDVNCKAPGQSRDAERIVTGDDGSAWYTGDHYASFTRMR
ncbi:ribonuclease domain-containing protein [Nocardia sp. NPDC059240]|uniref:ribonuclease domain-containing protein n=1 Tax=Nocardia sp. NPDC059240 TaxID=3346786 RepID=UPI00369036BA